MGDVDPEVEYHRTFSERLYYEIRPESRIEAISEKDRIADLRKRGARTAYTLRDKKAIQILYLEKEKQNFHRSATRWEFLHSKIPFGGGHGKADPVLNEKMTVVGHRGWFRWDSMFAPKGAKGHLSELLDNDVMVIADEHDTHYKRTGYADLPGGSEQRSFDVITDTDGRVKHLLGIRDLQALVSPMFSPIDLVVVPRLTTLAVGGMRKLVRMLARRGSAEAAVVASAEVAGAEAATVSAERAAAQKAIQGNPPAVTLGGYGEPGNLISRVDVLQGKVMYRVDAIVLKGEGAAAEIATARAAHREMIRRAGQEAQKRGQAQFTMRGINANSAFREHADKLAREIGVGGSGKVLPGSAPGYSSYEVTLDVTKAVN